MITTLPKIPHARYTAVKGCVRACCEREGLCPEAVTQCVDKAAKLLREGHTASRAIRGAKELMRRYANWRKA